MGEIIKIKNSLSNKNKKIIYLQLAQKEAQKLEGNFKKIHLFPEELCLHDSKIMERGMKNSAKYALIPPILRKRKEPRLSKIQYQKIETDSKMFYIVMANK